MYDYFNGSLNDCYTGATIKHITGQDLARYQFQLPSVTEQRRIAAILDQADALRRKRREAFQHVHELPSVIFDQMFGDLLKNTKGWPLRRVGEFVSGFQSGKNLVSDDQDDPDAPFRVLKVSAVTSLYFRPDQSKALPRGYKPPAQHIVKSRDLLFSRANTAELIGATAFVDGEFGSLVLPDKIWRFCWFEDARVKPLFVWFLFRQPSFRDQVRVHATGTSGSMKNISQENVLNLQVAFPPIRLQSEFARNLSEVRRLQLAQVQSADLLDCLFATLQHRAFRAEL